MYVRNILMNKKIVFENVINIFENTFSIDNMLLHAIDKKTLIIIIIIIQNINFVYVYIGKHPLRHDYRRASEAVIRRLLT